jgi:hypothetical protein
VVAAVERKIGNSGWIDPKASIKGHAMFSWIIKQVSQVQYIKLIICYGNGFSLLPAIVNASAIRV